MSAQMTSFLPSRTPSVSSSEDDDDDQNYDGWDSASGDPRARSLFEERELANIAEALKYDRETHGFDLGAFSKQLGMPDHDPGGGLVLILNQHSTSIKEYGWSTTYVRKYVTLELYYLISTILVP